MRAVTTTPVGLLRQCRSDPQEQRPSPLLWRVGSHNCLSRPARCSLTLRPAWPADLPRRPFLGVLQPIRCLLGRPKCFRLERKLAGSDLHRRIRCALARHTQQPSRERHPTGRRGTQELAVHRIGRAGKRAAVIQSLLGTAKLNGLDPAAWLKDTLEKLPIWSNSRIDELLPLQWNQKKD